MTWSARCSALARRSTVTLVQPRALEQPAQHPVANLGPSRESTAKSSAAEGSATCLSPQHISSLCTSLRKVGLRATLCVRCQRMTRRNPSIANLNCKGCCYSRPRGHTSSPLQVERPLACSKPCAKQRCFLHLTASGRTGAFLAPISWPRCRRHSARRDGSVLEQHRG